MKKTAKIGITVAAIATAGSLAFALPSLAHESGNDSSQTSTGESSQKELRSHAELEATITNIPTEVTDVREAASGAYYTAYKLADTETSLPATEPSTGGRPVMIHPERPADGSMTKPVVEGSSFVGELGFPAGTAGSTTRVALYPADGSAAVLVTIVVDADGVATATASAPLTLSYSADVAASAPAMEKGMGKGMGKGKHHGPRGEKGGAQDNDGDGPSFQMTPNA